MKVRSGFRGVKEQAMHVEGKRLTLRQAALAHCSDCMGRYADGRQDCAMPKCAMYPWMPYGSRPAPKKVISAKNRQAAGERLQKARVGKR